MQSGDYQRTLIKLLNRTYWNISRKVKPIYPYEEDKVMVGHHKIHHLTLIWVSFLGVRFEVWKGGGVGDIITPCLKFVRIMLETWYLVRKYTLVSSFKKYTFQYQDFLNFDDISNFLQKISKFGINRTFTLSYKVRTVLEIFYFCLPFL